MELIIAKHGGFCFGVKRAVEAALDAAKAGGVYTLGPIIHNPSVVEALAKQGVQVVNAIDEIAGRGTVVIRSHGVPPQMITQCQALGLHIIDATCPYVKRIHEKVVQARQSGRHVYIIGEEKHPEVMGIAGWAGEDATVLLNSQEAENIPKTQYGLAVAQTTALRSNFEQTVAVLREKVADLEVFDSICQATARRQAEAREIAQKCDAVLVLGGKNSSNTRKLFEIACQHTSRVFAIESAGEIPLAEFKPDDVVGIIAGASTPEWIIKEVVCRMSVLDMNEQVDEVMQEGAAAAEQEAVAQVDQPAEAAESEESQQDADFMQSVEETLRVLRKGQVLTGKIVQITENEVCVNIGYKSDGFIPKNEFSDDMDVDLRTVVNVGDEIDVCVLKVNDGEGNVLLSKKRVDSRKNWGTVMEMFKNNEYAEGVCKEVVKGGVIANILGIRAFIPASQLSQNYVENMQQFVGQTLQLKIIEVDEGRKRVVASRRAVLAEQAEAKKKEAWEKLTAGETILGTVKRITDFGAFVDVGGIDGLLHVTNMSWGRVNHPSDVVKPGDEIEVLILALDPEKERVSLGRKQLLPKPWEVAEQKYPVGSIVEGTVARIVSFGAFIELEPGLDGLVHISQIARHRIDKVEDVLEVGQKIQAKVLDVNTADKRISLSIRETLPEEEAPRYEDHEDSMEDSLYIPPQEETTFSLADFFPKQDD